MKPYCSVCNVFCSVCNVFCGLSVVVEQCNQFVQSVMCFVFEQCNYLWWLNSVTSLCSV